jgi:hypothetical protein
MEEKKINRNYMDCENDIIKSGKNVLIKKKLEML